MKHAWLTLLLAPLLTAGCMRTVSPKSFCFIYRHIDSPEQPTDGWISQYAGDDAKYCYLDVRVSDPYHRGMLTLQYCGLSAKQRIRCKKEGLPESFPTGIEQNWSETPEQAMQAVEAYLQRHGKP